MQLNFNGLPKGLRRSPALKLNNQLDVPEASPSVAVADSDNDYVEMCTTCVRAHAGRSELWRFGVPNLKRGVDTQPKP